MVKRKEKIWAVVGLFLSVLIVSPQFLAVSLMAQSQSQPRLTSEEDSSCVRILTEFNETITAYQFTGLETWTNGTKLHISEHAIPISPGSIDVWVNFTTWITENLTTQQTKQSKTGSVQPLMEGNLPKEWLDNIKFVYGSNSTCYTTYKHDDNYETYYASQWNKDYSLAGAQRTHIHLPANLMSDWINGNLTAAREIAVTELVGYCSGSLLADVAAALGCSIITVPTVVSVVYDILVNFIELYEQMTKFFWITTVVKEYFGGDGWTWRSQIMDVSPKIHIYNPFSKPLTVWDYYDARYWTQTWGKDGIFGIPQEYTVEWFNHRVVKGPPSDITYRPEETDSSLGP